MRLTLNLKHKGLILVAVPLLFELAFIAILTALLNESERQVYREMHSKNVIYEAGNLTRLFHDCGIAMAGYGLTKSPMFEEKYQDMIQDIPRAFDKMKRLVGDNPEQQASLRHLEDCTSRGLTLLAQAKGSIDEGSGTSGLSAVRNMYGEMKTITSEMGDELKKLTAESREIEKEGPGAQNQVRQLIKFFIVVAVVFNVLLSLWLAYFFTATIVRRLSVLTDNSWRLAKGQVLSPPLSGVDEIAHLDGVFHDMADALAEASRKERAVIENAVDVICSIDENGKFLKVSPASTNLWGLAPDELIGRNYLELIAPADLTKVEEAARAIRNGQSDTAFETTTTRQDGASVTVLWSVHWSEIEKSMFCVAHDISERKKAEEALRASEARVRTIIENMLVGLIIVDSAGNVETVNPRTEEMFGWSKDQLLGRNLMFLFPELDRSEPEKFMQTLMQKAKGRIAELEVLRKNGETFPIELSLTEFQSSEGRRLMANILDVSERREIERLKREFVSTVSHELRTPLTSIRGSLTLMSVGALGALNEQMKKVVTIAERNTIRLIGLINDILDIEKLQAGKLDMAFDNVDIRSVLERSIESVRAFADQNSVKVEASDLSAFVYADGDRLVQVVVNLLSNAIKFSEKGGSVTVAVEKENDWVTVKVIDRGRGIPAKYKDLIFERFQQVEVSDAKRKGGTGLGLTICKGIIEQHRGFIGVDSEEGQGSTFWFKVPSQAPSAAQETIHS